MANATFKYTDFTISPTPANPGGTTVRRPLAIATVTAAHGRSIRWIVLPDTGADFCLFPLSLAFLLQLDPLKMEASTTTGVGSQANLTYFDRLTINMGQGIEFTCKAGFTQGLDDVGFGLLGQSGFFSAYDVYFSNKNATFTVVVP